LAAIARAAELLDDAPWFAEAWNQRAIGYYGCGLFHESIADCHQALDINPYHYGAAAGIGQCYLQLGRPRLALECFRRALRLNPNLEGIRAHVTALERASGKK
jgi:tetratricopeptide (TPR) repeat protein